MPEEKAADAANENEKPDTASQSADAESAYAGVPERVVEEIKRLKAYNLELRKENERRRKAEEAAEAERRKREQEALAEQGKWRELAEQRERELEQLKDAAEKAAQYERLLERQVAARLKRIPEAYRGLVPAGYSAEQLLEWLDANEALLTRVAAPDLDAGQRGETARPVDARATLRRRSY